MAMVVKNNMSAVSTLNTLNKNSSALQKSLSKVSSGMKINSAQDDASGYAISERMRVQIRSLDQANQNTQNGSSMMKTAEGAVSSTVEILKSLKEKAINAANDTNKDADRTTIQKEIDQFIDQIDDNALTTFNGKYLVDGSKAQQGNATYTAMTNQSLAKNTTGDFELTKLENRNNESLEIVSTDYVTASFVQNGNTYTTKFRVDDSTLKNVFENLNTEYTSQTGKTGVFGAANIADPFATTTATYADSATALADVGTDSDALVTALKGGTDATSTKITGALTYLKNNAGSDAAITAIAGAVSTTATSLATAKTQLNTAIKTALAGAEVTFTNTSGSVVASNAATATFKDSANNSLTASADVKNGDLLGNGSETKAADLSGSSDTVIATVVAALDNVNDNNYATAIATASVVTASSSATNPVAAMTTGKDGSVAATSTAAKEYEAFKLLSDKFAPTAVAADVEILNGTDIGRNSAGDMVTTADGTEGLTVTASGEGVKGQISGVTISITDSEGNVKKAANAALDDFNTTIYAKNESAANELSFQVGASANQAIAVGLEDMRSEALGLKGSDGSKVSVATQDKANAAVKVFDNAIQKALDQQTTIGSIEARLEYTSQNLTTSSENVQAAESTIRDADMAKEMTNYTKNNVLLQAAQSMLAQANQSSSAVLSLLQ